MPTAAAPAASLHARSIEALAELAGFAGTHAPWGSQADLLISVILPTRCRPRQLAAAIRSVQAQVWTDWELLVVIDGEDPESEVTAAELARDDPRVRVFQLAKAAGGAAARNHALGEARGEVVAYLDDDNEYYPGYLQAIARHYAASVDTQCAYAAQLWIGDGSQTMVTFDRFDWSALRSQRMSIDMNVFSHRLALKDRHGGFDERLQRFIDWDLVLRYTAATQPARIPVMAVRYDWSSAPRISNRHPECAARCLIEDKHAPHPVRTPKILFVVFDYPQLSESYIHVEIRWLQTRGVEIEVRNQREPLAPGIATVPVHYEEIEESIRRFQPDIIHVHWMAHTIQNAEVLERAGVPVTMRSHGFDYSDALALELCAKPWLKRMYMFPGLVPPGENDPKMVPMPAVVDTSRYYPVPGKNRRMVLRAGACLPTKDLGLCIELAALRPEYRFVLALATNHAGVEVAKALIARNEELGNPAEILFDVQYEEMGVMMREAGIYLHTFGYQQAFGQPISIAEAMACATIPLVRDSSAARAYTGDAACYYDSLESASQMLLEMLDWSDADWHAQECLCIERAFPAHADSVVLPRMLEDWISFVEKTRRIEAD